MAQTRGLLVFARNNGEVDYVSQAFDLARRAHMHLGLPTTIVTDSKNYDLSVFDNVIIDNSKTRHNTKSFYDGKLYKSAVQWKNDLRSRSFYLSPYQETIVLDSDIVICNDKFLKCFDLEDNFAIYKESTDLVNRPTLPEFKTVSDNSVDFYWASCFFFRKDKITKTFFDLLTHIEQNWEHYIKTYNILTSNFRNDYLFSIGIHIMNGFVKGNFAHEMPGKLYHTTDKSTLVGIKDNTLTFVLEDGIACTIKDCNVHVMNKYSLDRCLHD